MPSLSQALWLALLLVVLAEPSRTSLVATDGDACWHWVLGDEMLKSGQIVRADSWSHTRFGQPMITKEWLAEILFVFGGRLGGLYGLCVVAALVIATTYMLLHRQLLREGNNVLIAAVVTLLAAWAGVVHWLARPHIFTLLLALLWHGALRRFEKDRRALRLTGALAVLMLLWVNLHGAFLVGFAILGAYWLGAAIELIWRPPAMTRANAQHKLTVLTAVSLLCTAVSLINPNGYNLHLHNIHFMGSDYLTSLLFEHRPIDFYNSESLPLLLWLAGMFVALLVPQRPRLSAGEVLVLLSWLYFGLHSVRNIPLLAILTAPIIAPALSVAVGNRWDKLSKSVATINASSNGWPVVALAAVAAILLVPRPTTMPPDRWPVAAVDFIKQHPEQFAGNMLNQHVWGGYLMRVLPEHKVFVDGRTDFYGEAFIRDFIALTSMQPHWREKLDSYRVSWTLLTTNHPLNQSLALLPDWRRVYSDPLATIFRRNP